MDVVNRACNWHQFVRNVLYTGCSGQVVTKHIVPLGTRRGEAHGTAGCWKINKIMLHFWATGAVVRDARWDVAVCGLADSLAYQHSGGEARASKSRTRRQQVSLKIWQTYLRKYTASYSGKLAVLMFSDVRISRHMSFLHRKRCWSRLRSICLSPCVRSARGRCMMHRLYLHHAFSYISRN